MKQASLGHLFETLSQNDISTQQSLRTCPESVLQKLGFKQSTIRQLKRLGAASKDLFSDGDIDSSPAALSFEPAALTKPNEQQASSDAVNQSPSIPSPLSMGPIVEGGGDDESDGEDSALSRARAERLSVAVTKLRECRAPAVTIAVAVAVTRLRSYQKLVGAAIELPTELSPQRHDAVLSEMSSNKITPLSQTSDACSELKSSDDHSGRLLFVELQPNRSDVERNCAQDHPRIDRCPAKRSGGRGRGSPDQRTCTAGRGRGAPGRGEGRYVVDKQFERAAVMAESTSPLLSPVPKNKVRS